MPAALKGPPHTKRGRPTRNRAAPHEEGCPPQMWRGALAPRSHAGLLPKSPVGTPRCGAGLSAPRIHTASPKVASWNLQDVARGFQPRGAMPAFSQSRQLELQDVARGFSPAEPCRPSPKVASWNLQDVARGFSPAELCRPSPKVASWNSKMWRGAFSPAEPANWSSQMWRGALAPRPTHRPDRSTGRRSARTRRRARADPPWPAAGSLPS